MKKLVSSLVLLATLAACGGGEGVEAPAVSTTQRSFWPLLDDEGGVMPSDPQSEPADPTATTRARRYASAAQASELEAALGPRAVRVELDAAAPADANSNSDADVALGIVQAARAAHQLPASVPVLLHARDPVRAAQVAESLADAGLTRVWVVGP